MKVKIKSWVHAQEVWARSGTFEYNLYPTGNSLGGTIPLCEVEVEVEVPEIDYNERKRAAAEHELKKAQAYFEVMKANLEKLQ